MKSRPEIDEELVRKIKLAYPDTAMMGIAETIEYILKRALKESGKN